MSNRMTSNGHRFEGGPRCRYCNIPVAVRWEWECARPEPSDIEGVVRFLTQE